MYLLDFYLKIETQSKIISAFKATNSTKDTEIGLASYEFETNMLYDIFISCLTVWKHSKCEI